MINEKIYEARRRVYAEVFQDEPRQALEVLPELKKMARQLWRTSTSGTDKMKFNLDLKNYDIATKILTDALLN